MDTFAVVAITALFLCGQASARSLLQGYATYSNPGGGVCPASGSSLPSVSINAAQFGNGASCGRCVQISGTGNGAGGSPVSTAPYIAVITNVCPQCNSGDLDIQSSGDGKFGISWSFVGCPGGRRRLIEGGDEDSVETTELPVVTIEGTVESMPTSEASTEAEAMEALATNEDSTLSDAQLEQPQAALSETTENLSQGDDTQQQITEQESSFVSTSADASSSEAKPTSRKLLFSN